LDNLLGRAAQKTARIDRILDARQLRGRRALRVPHDVDLLLGQRADKPEFAEHLHVLFVVFRGLAYALLAAVADVEMKAEAHALAECASAAELLARLLPLEPDRVHRAALGRAAADEALNARARHEVERPFAAALDRLPAFDRQAQRPRHQGQFL